MKNFSLRVKETFGKVFAFYPKENLGNIAPDMNNDIMVRAGRNVNNEEVAENDPNVKLGVRGEKKVKIKNRLENQNQYYKNQNK